MGVSVLEYGLFAGGVSLLAWFLVRTLPPILQNRLEATARRHAEELREEFVLLPTRKILMLMLAVGGLCASLTFAVTSSLLWTVLTGVVPFLLSGSAIRYYRTQRRRKVIAQLPGFLDILAGQVKGGHSFQEALSDTIPLLPPEIREEISWVFRLCRLGTPLTEAFLLWEERMPCDEVSMVVRPLKVTLPAGGNIVDLLHRSRDILRGRQRMREKLQSLTAQARLQAVVLTLLPPVFTGILSKLDAEFLPRLVGTPQGKAIVAVSAVLQFLGWLTIRKILAVNA